MTVSEFPMKMTGEETVTSIITEQIHVINPDVTAKVFFFYFCQFLVCYQHLKMKMYEKV